MTSPEASGDVVTVHAGGHSYPIVLPHREDDYIQTHLASNGTPYEEPMLHALAAMLDAEDLVLDVGANIGNHSLFLAHVAHAQVIAFEPNLELCDALRASLQLGDVSGRVEVHQCGVGEVGQRGTLEIADPSNLGGARMHANVEGDIDIIALDDLNLDQRVVAMKIDVEGMEMEVLRGAEKLISADRPHLFVEAATMEAYESVARWLGARGYTSAGTWNATPTHHFHPALSMEQGRERIDALVTEVYGITEETRSLRETLHAANLRYREMTSRVSQRSENLKSSNAALRTELRKTRRKLARLTADEHHSDADGKEGLASRIRRRLSAR